MESERRVPRVRRHQAAIRVSGSIRYLGSFPTKEERDERIRLAREEREATGDVVAQSSFCDSEVEDPWLIPTRLFTPAERLCAAMLLQAARDLASEVAHVRGSARKWVLSEATSFGSFRFCAETIGRDTSDTRRRMMRVMNTEKSGRIEGNEWGRGPSRPLRLVRRDSATN